MGTPGTLCGRDHLRLATPETLCGWALQRSGTPETVWGLYSKDTLWLGTPRTLSGGHSRGHLGLATPGTRHSRDCGVATIALGTPRTLRGRLSRDTLGSATPGTRLSTPGIIHLKLALGVLRGVPEDQAQTGRGVVLKFNNLINNPTPRVGNQQTNTRKPVLDACIIYGLSVGSRKVVEIIFSRSALVLNLACYHVVVRVLESGHRFGNRTRWGFGASYAVITVYSIAISAPNSKMLRTTQPSSNGSGVPTSEKTSSRYIRAPGGACVYLRASQTILAFTAQVARSLAPEARACMYQAGVKTLV